MLASPLRVGLLNLGWFGGARSRARQEQVVADARLDVLCLLEVDAADIERFAPAAGFSWWRCSVGADGSGRRFAVAIVGSSRVIPRGVDQLSVEDFLEYHDGVPMYPELACWYHERHLAVDLVIGDGTEIRVGAFHATPATSRDPGG